MALTIEQLAAALRIGTGESEVLEPERTILLRLEAASRAVIDLMAPTAPAAIADEAVIRMAGYLYDRDPADGAPSVNALRSSGAMGLISPWCPRPSVPVGPAGELPVPGGLVGPVTYEDLAELVRDRIAPLVIRGHGSQLLALRADETALEFVEPTRAEGYGWTRLQDSLSGGALTISLYDGPVPTAAASPVYDFLARRTDSREIALWYSGDDGSSRPLGAVLQGAFGPAEGQDGTESLWLPFPAGLLDFPVPLAGSVRLGNAVKLTMTRDGSDVTIEATAAAAFPAGDYEVWERRLPATVDPSEFLPDGSIGLTALAAAVLARMAPALTGEGGKFLAVKSDASAVELVAAPGGTPAAGSIGLTALAAAVLARMAPALTGEGGKFLAVKSDASAVELVAAPGGTPAAGSITLDKLAAAVLARMAPALAGQGGKFLAVKSDASAVELVAAPGGGSVEFSSLAIVSTTSSKRSTITLQESAIADAPAGSLIEFLYGGAAGSRFLAGSFRWGSSSTDRYQFGPLFLSDKIGASETRRLGFSTFSGYRPQLTAQPGSGDKVKVLFDVRNLGDTQEFFNRVNLYGARL